MNYPSYHMYQEILEQPEAVAGFLGQERETAAAIAEVLRHRTIENVVLVARGTSDHAAQLAKYLFQCVNGLPVMLAAPSVHTLYGAKVRVMSSLVIGISQSGEGLDVVEVVDQARQGGALTVGITNFATSPLARTAEYSMFCHAGVEQSLAATKTYLTQLAALYLLSFTWAGRVDLLVELDRVPGALREVLAMESQIKAVAPRYRYMQECVVCGRGFNYATALEGALKMKETSYVGSQPYSTADFLHGPIAVIDEGFPVFLVAPPGKAFPDVLALCQELGRRQAETIVFSSEPSILDLATVPLRVPATVDELLSPLIYAVPFQLLSLHIALAKGYNPDHPRGLKKVTLTR